MYSSGGAFTLSDVDGMTVLDRRWYTDRLKRAREEEDRQVEEAREKAARNGKGKGKGKKRG